MKEKNTLELDVEQMFSKVLNETHDLSKTIDFMIKWSEENYPNRGYICTNNEQEALLEQEWIEDRMKVYGMTKK